MATGFSSLIIETQAVNKDKDDDRSFLLAALLLHAKKTNPKKPTDQTNIYVAVPCRNQRLLCRIFRSAAFEAPYR